MHILLTVNSAWNIVNFRLPLVRALLDAGHDVAILAPRDASVASLTDLGCEFHDLKMDRKGINPINDIRLQVRFFKHFEALKPDCVLSFTIKNNIYGALAARRAKIPFLPNVTGLGTTFLSSAMLQRIVEFLYRSAFKEARSVFFQNKDDKRLFEDRALVRPDQAILLPGSGIDLEQFAAHPYPMSQTQTRFLMIARLLKDKGVREYAAVASYLRNDPSYQFELLGAFDPENRSGISQDELDGWVKSGTVTYHGSAADVRPFIDEAHCIVLPSYREGAPRTLIEGAAMARPLIASNVPGCRELVDEGSNGYFCKSHSAESLRTAVTKFESLNYEDKRRMGLAGRLKIEQEFSVDLVIASYFKQLAKLR